MLCRQVPLTDDVSHDVMEGNVTKEDNRDKAEVVCLMCFTFIISWSFVMSPCVIILSPIVPICIFKVEASFSQ